MGQTGIRKLTNVINLCASKTDPIWIERSVASPKHCYSPCLGIEGNKVTVSPRAGVPAMQITYFWPYNKIYLLLT